MRRTRAILSTLNEELPPDARDGRARERSTRSLSSSARPQGSTRPIPPSSTHAGVTAAALSVVRVVGDCLRARASRARVGAAPGLVVTNAHVVAGIDTPARRPQRRGPARRAGRLIRPDERHRRAACAGAGRRKPLRLADAVEGTPAGLLGYPGNGPYAETPVRVGRSRQDRRPRRVRALPDAQAGDDRSRHDPQRQLRRPRRRRAGRVSITTVFAQRAGSDGGYGVPTDVVRAALANAGTQRARDARASSAEPRRRQREQVERRLGLLERRDHVDPGDAAAAARRGARARAPSPTAGASGPASRSASSTRGGHRDPGHLVVQAKRHRMGAERPHAGEHRDRRGAAEARRGSARARRGRRAPASSRSGPPRRASARSARARGRGRRPTG